MKKKMILLMLLLIVLICMLAGCVPGDGSRSIENSAGFFTGLWHGIIVIFSFIGSWFNKNIKLYEICNNGFWYNLGYLFGFGGISFGFSWGSKNKIK